MSRRGLFAVGYGRHCKSEKLAGRVPLARKLYAETAWIIEKPRLEAELKVEEENLPNASIDEEVKSEQAQTVQSEVTEEARD